MTVFAEDLRRDRAAEAAEEERGRKAQPVHVVTLQAAPQPSPPAPAGDPRAALRAALARRDEEAATLGAARAALHRGDALLQEAEGDLARAAEAAEAVAGDWAARLRDWAAAGGHRPEAPADTGRPEHALAHTAAQRARATLRGEVAEAEVNLDQAVRMIDLAVRGVMAADAIALAARLAQHEDAARDLRERLSNLARTWVGRPPAPVPLRYSIVQLLRDPPRNAHRVRLDDPELRRPWINYARRLEANPETRPEDDAA